MLLRSGFLRGRIYGQEILEPITKYSLILPQPNRCSFAVGRDSIPDESVVVF